MNVANPIESSISERIKARGDGWVFSPVDFVDLGNRNAVDKALSRMAAARVHMMAVFRARNTRERTP
jgi:hypothetical protein